MKYNNFLSLIIKTRIPESGYPRLLVGKLQFSTHMAAPSCVQNITWFSNFFKITTTMKLKMTYVFIVIALVCDYRRCSKVHFDHA